MVSTRFALQGHLEKPRAMISCGLLWSPSNYFEPLQWTDHGIPGRLPSPLPTPLSKPQPTLLPILFVIRILRIRYQNIYDRIVGRSRLTLERKFAAVAVGLRLVAQSDIVVMVCRRVWKIAARRVRTRLLSASSSSVTRVLPLRRQIKLFTPPGHREAHRH